MNNKLMPVAEALASSSVTDELVTVSGHLVVTGLFSYLATGEFSERGVLVNEPSLFDRLLGSVPVNVGSLVLFSGRASVEGVLHRPTALPMFPAALHTIKAVEYYHDNWEPIRLEFG